MFARGRLRVLQRAPEGLLGVHASLSYKAKPVLVRDNHELLFFLPTVDSSINWLYMMPSIYTQDISAELGHGFPPPPRQSSHSD